MPSDLPDPRRDEDGPSKAELARWESGDLSTLTLDRERRRVIRLALKTLWGTATPVERDVIDGLLADLKAA